MVVGVKNMAGHEADDLRQKCTGESRSLVQVLTHDERCRVPDPKPLTSGVCS